MLLLIVHFVWITSQGYIGALEFCVVLGFFKIFVAFAKKSMCVITDYIP